ncbi:hypothetical protein C8J56DRAFT_398055 [Mycena floridula]|nr:hypothetical protein C8J56DRAFT_398055 [Mycena floridula]
MNPHHESCSNQYSPIYNPPSASLPTVTRVLPLAVQNMVFFDFLSDSQDRSVPQYRITHRATGQHVLTIHPDTAGNTNFTSPKSPHCPLACIQWADPSTVVEHFHWQGPRCAQDWLATAADGSQTMEFDGRKLLWRPVGGNRFGFQLWCDREMIGVLFIQRGNYSLKISESWVPVFGEAFVVASILLIYGIR